MNKLFLTIIFISAIVVASKITIDNLPFSGHQSVIFDLFPGPKCENGHIILHIRNRGLNRMSPTDITTFKINNENFKSKLNFPPIGSLENATMLDYNCEGYCRGYFQIEITVAGYSRKINLDCA